MKIGIGQIDTAAGDFETNARKILETAAKLAEAGAEFAVFPECAISGYPLKDLTCYKKFVEAAQRKLREVAEKIAIPAVVGCPRLTDGAVGVANSAYWLENKTAKLVADKMLLPNYGAADDPRNFDAGDKLGFVEFKGRRICVTVCEDIWTVDSVETARRYADRPKPLELLARERQNGGALDLFVNISASVFSSENDNVRGRGKLLCKVSEAAGAPLLWCNLVGGNDDLVFAGGSCYVDAAKGVGKTSPKFAESAEVVDTDNLAGFDGDAFDFAGIADVRKALVMATADFVKKCGARKVLLGLSGGIDSAVVAAIAVEALGRENVIGVSMPSKISSQHSKDDAAALARNLGIEFHTVGIAEIVAATEASLAPVFAGRARDVTEENIQSRARGLVLMAISNKFGALVLTTGNKSECAVGYCTLYGDTCGGFAPICDVYKTDVYKLARLINDSAAREIIPQNTIDKPPSAELRPDQKDEDSLPPYDLFDAILRLHIDKFMSVSEIVERGFDRAVVEDVARKVARAEYKRSQYPIGPKVSAVAYAADRKIPVAAKRGME